MYNDNDKPPEPGRLRYIAILSSQLGYPEPHVRNDREAKQELVALLAEKKKRLVLKQSPLAKAIYNMLAWEGEAMNYVSITNTLKRDYQQLRADNERVLAFLQSRKDLFRRITAGTYFLAGKLEGQTYPLM